MTFNRSFETQQLLRLAAPIWIAFVAQKSLQFIDTLMLGRLGVTAIASGALGMAIYTAVLMFCLGTLSVIGAYISRAFGLNTKKEIRITMQHAFVLVVFLSIPSMIFLWISPQILLLLGLDQGLVAATQLFIHGIVWGFPALLSFLVLREFVSAFALGKIIFKITLLAIPLTIVANYLLIYGKLGLPALGIAGVGYGATIVQWIMLISLLIFIFNHSLLKSFLFHFDASQIRWKKLIEMFGMGLPYGLMLVLDLGMGTMAILMMGYFGVEALAAHQIVVQCASIAFSLPFALSMAMSVRVQQVNEEVGPWYTKRLTFAALGKGLVLASFVAILFILFPEKLVNLFLSSSNQTQVLPLAILFFMLATVFQYFDTVQAVINGALRGLKETLIPMVVTIICYWILGIVSAFALAFYFFYNPLGIWYGLLIGIGSTALLLFCLFLIRVNKVAEF